MRQKFGKLVLLSWATCRPLTSLAEKCVKLQMTIWLPLEMRKVACGNLVILSPKSTQLIIIVKLLLCAKLARFSRKFAVQANV